MAKFKHNEETLHVLNDLDNRLTQLIEASEANDNDQREIRAFQSARTLIEQCKTTGHVFRGNEYFPDGLIGYYKTPSYINPLKVIKEDVND